MDYYSLAASVILKEMPALLRIAGLARAVPESIMKAEAATMSELAPDLPRQLDNLGDAFKDVQMLLRTSSSLAPGARDALYNLWEKNIKQLAKGTDLESDDDEKRDEMFDTKARFIILLKRPGAPAPETPTKQSQPKASGSNTQNAGMTQTNKLKKKNKKKKVDKLDFTPGELLGYCSFRFDQEDTLDDKVMAEVIYCYELQLVQAVRRKGLGKMLMQELELIGRARGMEKAFLTCLTKNRNASRFYHKIGYTPDEIDPTRMYGKNAVPADEKLDYLILSKSLRVLEEIEE